MVLSSAAIAWEPLDPVNKCDLGSEARIVGEQISAGLAEVKLGRQEKGNEAVAALKREARELHCVAVAFAVWRVRDDRIELQVLVREITLQKVKA
jgi:hypothetical protein